MNFHLITVHVLDITEVGESIITTEGVDISRSKVIIRNINTVRSTSNSEAIPEIGYIDNSLESSLNVVDTKGSYSFCGKPSHCSDECIRYTICGL